MKEGVWGYFKCYLFYLEFVYTSREDTHNCVNSFGFFFFLRGVTTGSCNTGSYAQYKPNGLNQCLRTEYKTSTNI